MIRDDETTGLELQKLLAASWKWCASRYIHGLEVKERFRVDIKRYQLLPDDQGCEYREKVGVGKEKQRDVA